MSRITSNEIATLIELLDAGIPGPARDRLRRWLEGAPYVSQGGMEGHDSPDPRSPQAAATDPDRDPVAALERHVVRVYTLLRESNERVDALSRRVDALTEEGPGIATTEEADSVADTRWLDRVEKVLNRLERLEGLDGQHPLVKDGAP